MKPLDDSLLVSADEPLTRFVPLLNKRPYRLVLVGTDIKGVVTRSDVAKAPVRLLAFTLVSHLEIVMTELIRRHCPDDQTFFKHLNDKVRKKRLESRLRRIRASNLVLPAIEFAYLGDKILVFASLHRLGPSSIHELKNIEELRNVVAHPKDYARTIQELGKFIERMSLARKWINKLQKVAADRAHLP
jgi:hypothetical protein